MKCVLCKTNYTSNITQLCADCWKDAQDWVVELETKNSASKKLTNLIKDISLT